MAIVAFLSRWRAGSVCRNVAKAGGWRLGWRQPAAHTGGKKAKRNLNVRLWLAVMRRSNQRIVWWR